MQNSVLAHLHKKSLKNRTDIENAKRCGCFYCLSIYPSHQVTEYWDNGETAVCPECGIDSVVCDSQDLLLTRKFLRTLRHYAWDGLLDDANPSEAMKIEICSIDEQ